jgi:hypothetical protein
VDIERDESGRGYVPALQRAGTSIAVVARPETRLRGRGRADPTRFTSTAMAALATRM